MSNHDNENLVQRVGLIGGSGFGSAFDSELSSSSSVTEVSTRFGDVRATISAISQDREIVFIPRHGMRHSVPPHRINHRANISALSELGVTHILATSAVGSLRREIDRGAMVVLDDFVDMRGDITTFFDDLGHVRHTDFSEPFDEDLRLMVLEEAVKLSTVWLRPPIVYPGGTYLCLNGPRYETPAEIKLFASWGLDVVGMTVAPEAILARELDIAYCNVAVVTNLGTGLSAAALAHSEVEEEMIQSRPFLLAVLIKSLRRLLGAV